MSSIQKSIFQICSKSKHSKFLSTWKHSYIRNLSKNALLFEYSMDAIWKLDFFLDLQMQQKRQLRSALFCKVPDSNMDILNRKFINCNWALRRLPFNSVCDVVSISPPTLFHNTTQERRSVHATHETKPSKASITEGLMLPIGGKISVSISTSWASIPFLTANGCGWSCFSSSTLWQPF